MARVVRVALATEGQQGRGVGPFRRIVVIVALQEALGVVVAIQVQQSAQEQVAHTLIVAGV